LLAQAQTAVGLWAADPVLRRRLADGCEAELEQAAAGSDLQLTWLRAWVSASTDAGPVAGVLAGSAPRGVAVDTELRWHVVRRLAVLGALTSDEIATELARDATAAGQRHADYALAARPDPAAKEFAWTSATGDLSLSNHATESRARGFWQLEQVELCRGYVERYFAEIESVWEARSPQVAKSLAALLYPAVVVEPAVLERSDDFLTNPALATGLRRVVLEKRDDLRRAIAARRLSEA
jgi:aminopeptidase N